jgi:hypothetical protein
MSTFLLKLYAGFAIEAKELAYDSPRTEGLDEKIIELPKGTTEDQALTYYNSLTSSQK